LNRGSWCPKFRQIRATLQLLLDRVDRKEFDIDSLQKQHEQVLLFLIHRRQRPKAAVAASNALLLLYGYQSSLRGNFLCTPFGLALKQQPNKLE